MKRILSFMGSNREFSAYLKALRQSAKLERIELIQPNSSLKK